jgi:RimJ/RimL family protein N-acetyltransferase/ribosomal protein S18 acetylase RimI-like enzyme
VIERIHAFRAALQNAAAERRVEGTHGTALLADSVREVYDLNYLRVEEAAPADELIAEAERLMEDFFHARVVLERPDDPTADAFRARGWTVTPHLIMACTHEPDRRVDTSVVREVPFEALIPARREATLAEPWADEEIGLLLDEAKKLVMRAVPTRFFAAVVDGEVAAYCEVRSAQGVAQIEDVNTIPRLRGRGLGRVIVQHAADEAKRANDVVYLEALAEDWPRELYAKIGFETLGGRHIVTRFPHPLTRLRVRTARLELRLATPTELRALAQVALDGIHDPGVMPFELPWTDHLTSDSFVAFHEQALEEWRPDGWQLNLVAFHDGRPIGSQGIGAERFSDTRRVSTGSWLGRRWQGQGLGTEMRGAVLELAFRGLNAQVAASGYVAGNPQSRAVSQKLGYQAVGSHVVAPRGEPLEHTDLILRRDDFAGPPVPVDIVGLAPLLPQFGAR